MRIDHIGSTAVAGVAAKPVIDIQISAASFTPLAAFKIPLESLGFSYRAENPDKSKRYFRGLQEINEYIFMFDKLVVGQSS